MIEYDRFIYLDVYRTGSSHMLKLLAEVTGQKPLRFHRHASLTKGRRFGFTSGKFVFTTVRNPWDWYVSLWAHGADGKSAIRRYLAETLKDTDIDRFYDQSQPGKAFRRWLAAMHDGAFLNRHMKEYLPESGLAPVLGLYSYRFLRVTTRFPRLLLRTGMIGHPEDAAVHLKRLGAYQLALRTESLDQDFAALVAERGESLGFRPDGAARVKAAAATHANSSTRKLASYRDYYDAESARLVEQRDRLFLTEFGYRF